MRSAVLVVDGVDVVSGAAVAVVGGESVGITVAFVTGMLMPAVGGLGGGLLGGVVELAGGPGETFADCAGLDAELAGGDVGAPGLAICSTTWEGETI